MMPHFSVLGFVALAYSLAQLGSFPFDDTSTLGLNEGESDLSSYLDETWSTSPLSDLDTLSDSSSDWFNQAETDPTGTYSTNDLWDDLGKLFASEETDVDTIEPANKCLLNPTQPGKVRSRRNEDQCYNSPPAKITLEGMINEQIKRKWCSQLPWLEFGNIPVARFADSLIFPVQPGALPDIASATIPLFGYYTLLKAALRKSIDLFCPAISAK